MLTDTICSSCSQIGRFITVCLPDQQKPRHARLQMGSLIGSLRVRDGEGRNWESDKI